jgi:hypothetical protein
LWDKNGDDDDEVMELRCREWGDWWEFEFEDLTDLCLRAGSFIDSLAKIVGPF